MGTDEKHDRIMLAHGGGGTLTWELLEKTIFPALKGMPVSDTDAAQVPDTDSLMFTTDSFVVKPLFFNGGDIGSLSIHGTLNDLAVSGAQPLAISMALIIEEGLEQDILKRILESAATAANDAGAKIITGDTKVVPRGEADRLYITTAGVGKRLISTTPESITEGDHILINGNIAQHGIAVISEREGLAFNTPVCTDSASVWPFVSNLIDAGIDIRAMRDPTRGGLASCCVELAGNAGVTFLLEETQIPVQPEVRAACEMLGFDPLTVANEGKLVVIVPGNDTEKALQVLKDTPGGENAVIIGKVIPKREKSVMLKTAYGGERIIEMPYGEDLPRIC